MDGRGRELGLRRHEVEVRERARDRELAQRDPVEQVERRVAVRAASETRRRVRLRVEIDEQAPLARLREARGEVDGGRRLADAALLVRNGDDPGAHRVRLASARTLGARRQVPLPFARGIGSGERALPAPCPVRRGKPGGRRAGLADHDEARRVLPRARPRDASATAATAARSAVGPTQSTTAPPSRTSGRHHSAAVGGCASAFATATPNVSSGCSSARPQTTRRFGQLRGPALEELALAALGLEQRHLARREATRRAGCPGVPPPEPTSTIGPSRAATSGTPASASSSSMRRASAGSRIAVRPGVATTAASQRSRSRVASAGSVRDVPRDHDDVAVRLGALARRRRPRDRPSAPRGRFGARPRSSARARRGCPSPTPARRSAARAPRASSCGARGSRPRRRRSGAGRRRATRCAIAFARYWSASIICPWRPISTPMSPPRHGRGDRLVRLVDLHRAGDAERRERPLEQLARDRGLALRGRRRRSRSAGRSTVATTRAGV